MKNYSAVILSAGYSSRMGHFKPLMELNHKNPLEMCIELFLSCGIKNIIVVTGYLNENIEKQIKENVQIVFNDKFDEGMYSSVKAGVKALNENTDAFFILPVDIPSIKQFTIKKMIESYEKSENSILFPTFGEEKGHPGLMPYLLSGEILKNNPEYGLRDILNSHKDKWNYLKVCDRGILLDMDTPKEFHILLDHISAYPYPDYDECMEILRIYNVREDTIMHMKAVGNLAKKITLVMNEKGYHLNINAAYSGALLHDVAKGSKAHEEEGAKIVEALGYICLSEIIRQHSNLKDITTIDEKEIVYLSDKLIKGTEFITLDERFEESLAKYKNNPSILKNINRRFCNAKIIKKNIEKVLEISLENLR